MNWMIPNMDGNSTTNFSKVHGYPWENKLLHICTSHVKSDILNERKLT